MAMWPEPPAAGRSMDGDSAEETGMKHWVRIWAVTCAVAVSAQAWGLEIVREGRPTATLMLPEKPNESETMAAKLLERYLGPPTGARFRTVSEPTEVKGNIISVGHTKLARAAGLTEEGLTYDGYRIRVRGNVLYLFGRFRQTMGRGGWTGCRGTYRAAFGLLERLGFRWVAPGHMGVVTPEFKDRSVHIADDLNVTHNPPFMYSIARFDRHQDWSWANGFRLPVSLYTQGGHTWEVFVPKSLWAKHPDCFAMDPKGQRMKPAGHNHFLCPTHPKVIQYLAKGLGTKFDEGYDLVQLGQSDGYTPCHCARCQALG